MASRYRRSTAFVVAALGSIVVASAAAAEDLTLPPPPLDERRGYEATSWLTLKPYLRQGVSYTNNVFQERPLRRDGDTVYYTIPGLDAYLEQDQSWLELGYAPTVLLYHHFGELDTVEHRLRYVGHAELGALTASSSGSAAWAAYNTDPQFTGRVRNFQGSTNLDLDYAFTDLVGVRSNAFASESRNFPTVLEPTNTQEWGGGGYVTLSPNVGQKLQLVAGSTLREIHYFNHRARRPDLSIAGAVTGAKLEVGEWLRVDLLAGVEFPWIKKHNGTSRAVELDPHPIVNFTAALRPLDGTELVLSARHRLEASASSVVQRGTTLSCTLSQELRRDLVLSLIASWRQQDPRRSAELRTQSYQAVLTWQTPWEHLELGVQGGYTRSSVKSGGYESMSVAAALTLKL